MALVPPPVAAPVAAPVAPPASFSMPPLLAPALNRNPRQAQEQRALRVDFLLFGGLGDVPGQALRQTFLGSAIPQHYETAIQRALWGDRRDALNAARETFTDAERREVSGAVAKVVGELIGDGIPAGSKAFGAGVRSAFDLASARINARRRAGDSSSTPAPNASPTASPTASPRASSTALPTPAGTPAPVSGSTPASRAPAIAPQAIPHGLTPDQLAARIGEFLPRAGSNPPAVYGTKGGPEARRDAAAFNRTSDETVALALEVEARIGDQSARTFVVYSGVDAESAANLARNVEATSTFTVLNRDTALRDAGLSPEGLAARIRRREDGAFARSLPVIGGRQMSPLTTEQGYADARSTVRGNNESAIGRGRIDSLDLIVPMQKGRSAHIQGVTRSEATSLLDATQGNGSLRTGVSVNDIIAANGLGALLGTDARGRAFVRETPQALNAPGATPEVPALPRETAGVEQAERRDSSVGEAWERAGRTLEELERLARQPFSKDLGELVEDKADAIRGKGDDLGALMLEMTHHSRSAPGNVIGARGGVRSAPAHSSALLNRIRNTEAEKTAAVVNGPLRRKLDTLPNEFRDAMLQSLAGAKEPSKTVEAAMLRLRRIGGPGSVVGADGGSRSAPAHSNDLLDRIRNTEAEETAAIVNGPLRRKLDTLPDEFRDAFLQSLASAKEPSDAVKAAILRLDRKGAKPAESISPSLDDAAVAKRPISIPTPFRMPDLPNMSSPIKFNGFLGNNVLKDTRHPPAEQPGSMLRTPDQAIAGDRPGVAPDRDGYASTPDALRGRQAYPDPRDPLAVARWINGEWLETVVEDAPPPVRDQMAQTLDEALRSNRPEFAFEYDDIRGALNALRATGARAFPSPGEASFGLDGPAVMPKSEEFGLPNGFEYLGPDISGNPVFENADGSLVGPFSEDAAPLADSAWGPLAPKNMPTTLFQKFRSMADLRLGVGGQLTAPTGDPIARSTVVVGLDTLSELRLHGGEMIDAIKEKRFGAAIDIGTTALGIGLRVGEFINEPRAVGRALTGLVGLRGLGVNSALQFKVESLEREAARIVTGASSAFNFNLSPTDGIDTSEAGLARIRGNLTLNVTEVPTQMDAFGNDKGRKFQLNHDLTVDKTLREIYLPSLSIGPLATPSGEYREESTGRFVIPAGTILPQEFVEILNRRIGNSQIELTLPAPIANAPLAVAREIVQGLADRGSFLDDLDPAEIEARMVTGFAQRISSIPRKELEGANNLDVNYMALEHLPNQIFRNIAEGLGISRIKFPFDRAIPGTPDPVNNILDDNLHGYAKKVRFKVNLPLRIDLPGAKLAAAFYMVREAQPDLRTSMMRSNDAATLSFSDAMGSAREVSVPTWLASLVSASDGSGRFEAQLGMARFPDGGIVVPPGGTEGLRSFMRQQWDTGTETDKREIATFLSTYMSGPTAKIADNKTLMPADRDRLIELLYRIADPVEGRSTAE